MYTKYLSFLSLLFYLDENKLTSQNNSVKHESVIGFSAFKYTDQEHTSGEVIGYRVVLLNEGGFYLPSLSRFQCPEDGIYYVTMSTYNFQEDTNVGLTLNSTFQLHTRGISINDRKQMSNSRLVKCSQGDILAVKSLSEGAVRPWQGSTSFSAVLMTNEFQGCIFFFVRHT